MYDSTVIFLLILSLSYTRFLNATQPAKAKISIYQNNRIINMENVEKISRFQFLKNLGFSGASLMAVYCGVTMTSCKNESSVTPTPTGGITFDLTNAANKSLLTKGGFVVDKTNNIVVALSNENKYIAVTLICSHEQQKEIVYQTNKWFCNAHQAQFDNTGAGLNSNGKKGLKTYTVTQSGNVLTVS